MACADLLESPRISFSRDFAELDLVEGRKRVEKELVVNSGGGDEDFEFCMGLSEQNPTMLPAEELIFQGKIRPFQLPQCGSERTVTVVNSSPSNGKPIKSTTIADDACNPSPRAPKCSWKELLGLKKLQNAKNPASKVTPKMAKKLNCSTKQHKGFEPSTSFSLSQPLLQSSRDSDADSASARFSLSDLEELQRYSVDSINEEIVLHKPLRPVRVTRPSDADGKNVQKTQVRKMREDRHSNASGKAGCKGLERSCSSPSSFRKRDSLYKSSGKGLERSYSANVRVTPVLNVPVVCIRKGGSKGGGGGGAGGGMFGLTNLFSPHQKKDLNKPNRNSSQKTQ